HQRTGRYNCSWTHERPRSNQRMLTNTHVIEQNRAYADQRTALDVAPVKSDAMSDRYFLLQNSWMSAVADMYDGVVLHVGSCANTNVIDISPTRAIAPS